MMKQTLYLLLFFCSSALFAQSYQLNNSKSSINWIGYKVGGSHEGSIQIKSSDFNLQEGRLESGAIAMDMTSIVITDIESESGNQKLMEVFQSESFFDIPNYTTAQLSLSECTFILPKDELAVKGAVKAHLTIKSITKQQTCTYTAQLIDGELLLKGTLRLNRQDYAIQYGNGFFSSLGDKAIKDEFLIHFELRFNRL